jgi:hemolysin activation/secretion protein
MRILRLSLLYQNADRFQGANTLTTELSKGLDIFGTKPVDSPNTTRFGGDPLFTKITFEASRLQRLTDRFQLYAAATGQKSADNLLSSEEFGVGGASYGSAYDSSEITGVDGLAGRVELRASDPRIQGLQPYGFYDIGKVWDQYNSDAKSRITSLASAGFGLRASLFNTVAGSVEYAVPLTKAVEAGHSMQPRLFSSLTAKF